MKKSLYFLLALFLIYWIATFFVPAMVEKSANKVTMLPPYTASQKATDLYNSFDFVGDLHCDALLWNRDLTVKSDYAHVDFPRMQEGNVAFQAFTLVTKSPKGQNFHENSADAADNITRLYIAQGEWPTTWFSLFARAKEQCESLFEFEEDYNGEFIVVENQEDFQRLLDERAKNRRVIGGMLGAEGGHCLEGELENLDKLYEAGVRMLGATHFFDNELGGSAHGESHAGLSPFGFEVMNRMEELGMIMDIAHVSPKVVDDILANFDGPIVSSHTGVKGTHDSPRNLSDAHLLGVAAKDGLIGIAFFAGAVGATETSAIVKAMRYTTDLIGVEHVALGSDYDGSVTTPFDITGFPLLVDKMLKQGFSESEIEAIMGGNLKRFCSSKLPLR